MFKELSIRLKQAAKEKVLEKIEISMTHPRNMHRESDVSHVTMVGTRPTFGKKAQQNDRAGWS
jgi:hypothetical protein